jgi:hypothetical protein
VTRGILCSGAILDSSMGILESCPAGEVCSTAWALERKSEEEGSGAKRGSQQSELTNKTVGMTTSPPKYRERSPVKEK